MKTSYLLLLVFAFGLFLAHSSASEVKLTSSDGEPTDDFGQSVAVFGDFAVIGAAHDANANGNEAGAAYVYMVNGSGWIEQSKLMASDGQAGDLFGTSVAIDGNYILVGAIKSDGVSNTKIGAAYVFHFDGSSWTEQAILAPKNKVLADHFGSAVDIFGDYAIVGAERDNLWQGTAHIFKRTGDIWLEEAELTAADGSAGDRFGYSVTINAEYAVIGAYFKSELNRDNCGKAYVFHFDAGNGWQQIQQLMPDNGGHIQEYFGYSLDMYMDKLVVGAFGEDHLGYQTNTGAAYIYHLKTGTWEIEHKFTAPDMGDGDMLGRAVAIRDDFALIGAPFHDVGELNTGSVYTLIFENDAWKQKDKQTPAVLDSLGFFGVSLAVSDEYATIGAGNDFWGTAPENEGAFIYENQADLNLNYSPVIEDLPTLIDLETNGFVVLNMNEYESDRDSPEEVLSWSFDVNDPSIEYSFNDETDELTIRANENSGSFDLYTTLTDDYAASDDETVIINVNKPSSIGADNPDHPAAFALRQNYPNPFNPFTTIRYALPERANVLIDVYDTNGRIIQTLFSGLRTAGYHEVKFDASELSSGLYFYRIKAGNFEDLKKMILLK